MKQWIRNPVFQLLLIETICNLLAIPISATTSSSTAVTTTKSFTTTSTITSFMNPTFLNPTLNSNLNAEECSSLMVTQFENTFSTNTSHSSSVVELFVPGNVIGGTLTFFALLTFFLSNFVLTILRRNHQPLKARSIPLLLSGQIGTAMFALYVTTRVIIPVPLYPCAVFTFIMTIGLAFLWVYPITSSLRCTFITGLKYTQVRIDKDVLEHSRLNPTYVKLKDWFAFLANSKILLIVSTCYVLLTFPIWILVTWLVDDSFLKFVTQCNSLNVSLMFASIVYNTLASFLILTLTILMIIAKIIKLFDEHYNLFREMLFVCSLWLFYEVVTLVVLVSTPPELRVEIIPKVIGPVTIICMTLQTFICCTIPIFVSFFWNKKDINLWARCILTVFTCSTFFWRNSVLFKTEKEKRISLGVIEKPQILGVILSFPTFREAFKEYCTAQLSFEDIACFEMLEQAASGPTYDLDGLKVLKQTYIEENSVRAVNIDSAVRENFLEAINVIEKNLAVETTNYNRIEASDSADSQTKPSVNVAIRLGMLRNKLLLNMTGHFILFFSGEKIREKVMDKITLTGECEKLGLI